MTESKTEQKIVTSQAITVKHKKKLNIAFVVILVLAIVLGIYLYEKNSNSSNSSSGRRGRQTVSTEQAFLDKVNSEIGSSNFKAAEGDIKNSPSFISSAEKQSLLAMVYSAMGNREKALSIYGVLNKSGKLTASDAVSAAQIEAQYGKPQAAIAYYKKAISLTTKHNDPTAADDTAYYKMQIADLQKSPEAK